MDGSNGWMDGEDPGYIGLCLHHGSRNHSSISTDFFPWWCTICTWSEASFTEWPKFCLPILSLAKASFRSSVSYHKLQGSFPWLGWEPSVKTFNIFVLFLTTPGPHNWSKEAGWGIWDVFQYSHEHFYILLTECLGWCDNAETHPAPPSCFLRDMMIQPCSFWG